MNCRDIDERIPRADAPPGETKPRRLYELKVVREPSGCEAPVYLITPGEYLNTPGDVYRMFAGRHDRLDREEFLVLLLDNKNRMLGFNIVSVGSLTASVVHPREVFKAAIIKNTARIVLVHNHPSGDPAPSREDIDITKRLKQAGDILGIQVLDHVIIGDGQYFSFSEKKML